MGDRCFMSVTCRQQDKARFAELGFQVQFGEDENNPVLEMIDAEANYGHCHELPTDIPFTAWNGAGSDYGEAKLVCDGREIIEVSTNHDGSFCVDWNFRFGLPRLKSILQIRRYLRLERRVNKLFEALREEKPKEHLFSPHTNICVKCGQSAEDDAVENTPCSK